MEECQCHRAIVKLSAAQQTIYLVDGIDYRCRGLTLQRVGVVHWTGQCRQTICSIANYLSRTIQLTDGIDYCGRGLTLQRVGVVHWTT